MNPHEMKVYYYFILPMTDKFLSVYSDPSLDYIKICNDVFNALHNLSTPNGDEIKYYVLKSVEESSVELDTKMLLSLQKDFERNKTESLLLSLIESFNFDRDTRKKYIALAHQPLLILNKSKKKVSIVNPKTLNDVFSHCVLHLYQFLHMKRQIAECKKMEQFISFSDTTYSPGVSSSARFAICCLNNIVVEAGTKKLLLLKHECSRNASGRFDNNLYETVNDLLK